MDTAADRVSGEVIVTLSKAANARQRWRAFIFVTMKKAFGLIGTFVGGWLGWYAGAIVSPTVAFLLSAVASGIGMYIGIRMAQRYS
jgi:zinc transporter ZupT